MFSPDSYDLVLLDIQLPDMTGFDIAKNLRENYEHLPPLVALTANIIKDKSEYLKKGMDEAISKPINAKALSGVIQRQALTCALPDTKETSPVQGIVSDELSDTLLDLDMLTSYVDLVGAKPVLDSITMFEEMMPGYIEILDSNMTARDKEGIVSEAHKIKGAAGSIGLKHIQQLAQKAQSPELPAWWENVSDWLMRLKKATSTMSLSCETGSAATARTEAGARLCLAKLRMQKTPDVKKALTGPFFRSVPEGLFFFQIATEAVTFAMDGSDDFRRVTN